MILDGRIINTSAPGTQLPTENAELAKYANKIIWNFSVAQNINVKAHGIVGSVLAPEAMFNADGGSINGMLIADSFKTTNGHELHGFKLNNNIFDFTNTEEEEDSNNDLPINVNQRLDNKIL